MKTKYPSIFGLLAVFMLVASLVVPANLARPASVEALDPICQWDVVDTPAIKAALWSDVVAGSEVTNMVVGSDGATIWFTDPGNAVSLRKSGNFGIAWSGGATTFGYLLRDITAAGVGGTPFWFVAMAPDDVNFAAVVVDATGAADGPYEVYVTEDGGSNWQNTGAGLVIGANEVISCIDISMSYGGARDIAIGTRNGVGGGNVYVLKAPGFTAWTAQIAALFPLPGPSGLITADVYKVRWSPTYVGDAALVIVASGDIDAAAAHADTMVYMGIRDLALSPPTTVWTTWPSVEVGDPTTAAGSSPTVGEMITADLELPSDFSGQSASLRRMYVSTDAQSPRPSTPLVTPDTGIFRVDDTTVYYLMNTTGMYGVPAAASTNFKRIYSIAYYGTYASGKLLAGEVLGWTCEATVPTWFTDSPTTCPIPCWYPALKPTTGAACQVGLCGAGWQGWGNADVAWRVDGALAFVGTSAASTDNFTAPAGVPAIAWPDGFLNTLAMDESAFGLSRNNGETWNQLSFIDTLISEWTDVAPAADCSTIYVASVNDNTTPCCGFDSVWRSGTAANVVAPLPPLPLGTYWERVLCHVTEVTCNLTQIDHAILRLAPDKTDGQILFWAAGGLPRTALGVDQNSQAVMWSPDYGDYWARINPRITVMDLAAASSTKIYIVDGTGMVQTMPYTGTAWSSAETSVSRVMPAHTIAALGDDWVLVGTSYTGGFASTWPVSYSSDGGKTFGHILNPPTGDDAGANVHVAFDSDFANNSIIYAAFDDWDADLTGSIWRWQLGTSGDWTDILGTGAFGSVHRPGYYGIALAYTGGALYGAHAPVLVGTANVTGVERTLTPAGGLPKPGITWDCLNIFTYTAAGFTDDVFFTEEPSSLKLCGCLTMDTDTSLWAIDNQAYVYNTRGPGLGDLWTFTDCVAKTGPVLTMEDGLLVGCDPVSGRNQEINFTWEQLCLGFGHDIEIAKDPAFSQKVFDYVSAAVMTGFYHSDINTMPAMIFPVGATDGTWPGQTRPYLVSQLECGHKYYWKVKVRSCITGQVIRSPWSEVRSFTIKAGLPVTTPYYGPQLLSPNNGCIGCPVSPASFSWSPFKGSTSYKFQLAKDAAMTDIIAEDTTGSTTAYEYAGTLDYSTNYFWRVMAVEPAPSDWSATFSFQTGAAPEAPPAPEEAPATPLWVWVVIALGAILVIVTLVLIFKTRRV